MIVFDSETKSGLYAQIVCMHAINKEKPPDVDKNKTYKPMRAFFHHSTTLSGKCTPQHVAIQFLEPRSFFHVRVCIVYQIVDICRACARRRKGAVCVLSSLFSPRMHARSRREYAFWCIAAVRAFADIVLRFDEPESSCSVHACRLDC